MEEQFKDLEDYGIIGNLETCGLVGVDGSIDWLCLPYLESTSVFGALLDLNHGGLFRIRPLEKYRSIQTYLGDTNVLKTLFHSSLGTASITDFMPVNAGEEAFKRAVMRKVEWQSRGEMELEFDFEPRFDYGQATPEFEEVTDGVIARWQDESLFFHCPVPWKLDNGRVHGVIRTKQNSEAWFVIQYKSHRPLDARVYESFLQKTLEYWKGWAHTCPGEDCLFAGPWHDIVMRSGLILKLLINNDSGAIAAAATTSLPEVVGGIRNWDYRFSWIRDASFTAQALYHLGHKDEARAYRNWIHKMVNKAKEPSEIKVLYPIREKGAVSEHQLALQGYRESQPVHIGNKAESQKQLDIYGEILNAVYATTQYGEDVRKANWPMLRSIVDYVCDAWKEKDSGIWEDRVPPQDFVYSKLMCWVAVDRGIRIAKEKGFEAPVDKWSSVRSEIREAILEKGFNRKLNSFVRTFETEDLDATALLIPVNGFLPFDDPRVQGTVDAVMNSLMNERGLVARYNSVDGLPGKEGSFILCSFWLVMVLSLSNRHREAEEIFTKVLRYMSPLGLISEEIDPQSGKLLGNIPQAFSQIGLINAALHIGVAKGKKQSGPRLMGQEQQEQEAA